MKKWYCVICGRKFLNHKIYFFWKILVISIIGSKCENKDEKIFKKNQMGK